MACSNLRWICRKAAITVSAAAAARCPSYNILYSSWRRGIRTMSVPIMDDHSVVLSSPWLVMPPVCRSSDNNLIYRFYSLAENKVLTINKRGVVGGGGGGEEPEDDARFVGSSHGWLILENRSNNKDLFLSNPISRRHIKLPSTCTLPISEGHYSCVTNVIISCSPDDGEECRAMMIFDDRLAFCCPGRSSDDQWTLIGDDEFKVDKKGRRKRRGRQKQYESCVYSSRQKLFYCLTDEDALESWDLQNPNSPRVTTIFGEDDHMPEPGETWDDEHDKYLFQTCIPLTFLALAVNSKQEEILLQVTRHVMESMAPDGSYVDCISREVGLEEGGEVLSPEDFDKLPYKTIGFDIHKYDVEKDELMYMEDSLDGLAIFIGINHSFCVRVSEYPELKLKPNSIYYTDIHALIGYAGGHVDPPFGGKPFGGHDIGIFDYQDKTFSPCYYPCHVQGFRSITPPPMWFTPTPF